MHAQATPSVLPTHFNTTAWLAHRLEADLGFHVGGPPEVMRLAQACAVVLSRKVPDPSAVVKFEVVCLVDRESYPEHFFPLEVSQLRAIGQSCLRLAGKSHFGLVQNHLRITVVEVSARPMSEGDTLRLKALHVGGTGALLVESVYLDTTARSSWSSSAFARVPGASFLAASLTPFDGSSLCGWLEGAIHEAPVASQQGPSPEASEAHAAAGTESPGAQAASQALPTTPQSANTSDFPIVTTLLVALLVIVFVGQSIASRSIDPAPDMLLALGGVTAAAVKQGEWFRLLTASLLHGGVIHILLNAVALFLGGALVEAFVGRAWLVVIYTLSALAGSLLGVVMNDASVVSVGASGAIMGLLAASLALTLRLPKGLERSSLQVQVGRFLIPSLLPIASDAVGGGKVDYAAHFGGAIAGGLIGLLLVAIWGKDLDRAPLKKVGAGLAVLACAAFAIAALGAFRTYPAYAEEAMLDADEVLVKEGSIPQDDDEQAKAMVEVWGKDRPRDPRVRLFRGLSLIDKNDLAGAEAEFRAGLAEDAILRKFFGNRKIEILLRGMLSAVLIDQDRRGEAETVATPVCNAGDNGGVPDMLERLGLCAAHAH